MWKQNCDFRRTGLFRSFFWLALTLTLPQEREQIFMALLASIPSSWQSVAPNP